MRIHCAIFMQRILRPRNRRTENPVDMSAWDRSQKRLWMEEHHAHSRRKHLISGGIIRKQTSTLRRFHPDSDWVVVAAVWSEPVSG